MDSITIGRDIPQKHPWENSKTIHKGSLGKTPEKPREYSNNNGDSKQL